MVRWDCWAQTSESRIPAEADARGCEVCDIQYPASLINRLNQPGLLFSNFVDSRYFGWTPFSDPFDNRGNKKPESDALLTKDKSNSIG